MGKILLKNDEALDESLFVCRCKEFQLSEMYRTLSENPELSFDRFLNSAELADRCTACLLDLEYYFIQLPRDGSTSPEINRAQSNEDKIPFRQKFYRFVDRLSPKRAIRLPNHLPVLFGENVQQWLWMANHQLDYNNTNAIPDFDVHLTMYNEDGDIVWRDTRPLLAGSEWREELTKHTPDRAGAEISAFWLDVTRCARSDGVRGTTRPQIEIVTPTSSCAVHGQAAGFSNGCPFELIHCPDEDRVFVSIINIASKPLDIELRYPEDPTENLKLPVRTTEITIPAKGIRLHEVVLNKHEQDAFRNRLFRFSWHGYGEYKAHVIVGSKQLDRFSIDHS